MTRTFIISFFAAAALSGCAVADSKDGGMCEALKAFAESIDDSATHSVTLRTDWGAEPTKSCEREDRQPELALCAYLIKNTSWEFMAINVSESLRCVGVKFPDSPEQAYIETLAGSVRSSWPAFTEGGFDVQIDFNTAGSEEGFPRLRISVTRQEPE
jgi:hypothetical protein